MAVVPVQLSRVGRGIAGLSRPDARSSAANALFRAGAISARSTASIIWRLIFSAEGAG